MVRRLVEADWPLFKVVRIRALREAPNAFSSTAAEAEHLADGEWRRRLAERAVFLASDGVEPIGMVTGVTADEPDAAELISMWVDPVWRSRGVGRMLVNTVVNWATSREFQSLRLWVAEGNDLAERLYAACGFRRTGEVQAMPSGDRTEFAMAMPLPVREAELRKENRGRVSGADPEGHGRPPSPRSLPPVRRLPPA
jgi:ribosomal protein S18 acetylase RimI-like enzyme